MTSDFAPRRPAWPWVLTAIVVIVGGGVFVAQSQALARESEQNRVRPTAAAISPTTPDGVPAPSSTPDGVPTPSSTPHTVPSRGPVAAEGRRNALVAPDPTWTATTAARTGIPERALRAYAGAALTVQAEQPACGLGWNTLAGLGAIESAHGTHSGGVLRADGYPEPPIRGIPLDGSASAAITDTDGGRFDGDAEWDRAVGPLQFIPATWARWGADGNGDGAADPNQIDDAGLAAGRYLCAAGEMSSPAGWRRAVFSYNHLDSYVDDVAAAANTFARLAG